MYCSVHPRQVKGTSAQTTCMGAGTAKLVEHMDTIAPESGTAEL